MRVEGGIPNTLLSSLASSSLLHYLVSDVSRKESCSSKESKLTVVRHGQETTNHTAKIKTCMATTVSYLRVGTVLQFSFELCSQLH